MANIKRRSKPDIYDVDGVLHDMRTPISVIKGYLDTISLGDNDVKGFHLAAQRSVTKLLSMMDYLDSDITSHNPQFKTCDVSLLVKIAIDEIKCSNKDMGCEIKYVGPNSLMANVDDILLGRVVSNLVKNSIEASRDMGTIRVELFSHKESVFVEIVDCGNGIATYNLQRIFERGFTSGKKDGHGVGLHLCKKIVNAHGGTIEVYSRKKYGSSFIIKLSNACTSEPIYREDHNTCNKTQNIIYTAVKEDTFDVI